MLAHCPSAPNSLGKDENTMQIPVGVAGTLTVRPAPAAPSTRVNSSKNRSESGRVELQARGLMWYTEPPRSPLLRRLIFNQKPEETGNKKKASCSLGDWGYLTAEGG